MITRELLRELNSEFRVFTETDYYGFAGVESPVPLIAEYKDKYIVIVDGCICQIFDEEMEMIDHCEDIRDLPGISPAIKPAPYLYKGD